MEYRARRVRRIGREKGRKRVNRKMEYRERRVRRVRRIGREKGR
jgi:hypothetical protein